MSTAVAGALERHEPADLPAAVVKVLGTTTEGDIAEFADLQDSPDSVFSGLVHAAEISGLALPCVAAPTRCYVAWLRADWACDDRRACC